MQSGNHCCWPPGWPQDPVFIRIGRGGLLGRRVYILYITIYRSYACIERGHRGTVLV